MSSRNFRLMRESISSVSYRAFLRIGTLGILLPRMLGNVDIALWRFFLELHGARNCLLYKFSSWLLHLRCYSQVVHLEDFSLCLQVFQFVLWCFACVACPRRSPHWGCHWHEDLEHCSVVIKHAVSRVHGQLRRYSSAHCFDWNQCHSQRKLGLGSTFANSHSVGFPKQVRGARVWLHPRIFECYFWSWSRRKAALKTTVDFPVQWQLFQRIHWFSIIACGGVCQNFRPQSCALDKFIPIHNILFKSPLCLVMHFSWVGVVSGWLCFDGIAVRWIKRCQEDCFSSFCIFWSSCHQSSFRNRISVSRTTHMVEELFPLQGNQDVIHQFCLAE